MAAENGVTEAARLLADGRYLEAQQAFEALWREGEDPDRDLYRGWVLLAAALFHRDRGNHRGAELCFARAERRWTGYSLGAGGIDLAGALAAVDDVLGKEWRCPDLPWPARERRKSRREGGGGWYG